MKKTGTVINKQTAYDMSAILNNTALIYSVTRESCLFNLKTFEKIGDFDKYHTTYYNDKKLFFLERTVEEEENGRTVYAHYVDIYDAEKEEYLAKKLKHINQSSYNFALFENPETLKKRLLDIGTIRKDDNIFNLEIDSMKCVLDEYYGTFYVIEKDGKKGLYKKGEGFVTPIECNDIKRINNQKVLVYETDKGSYFSFRHVDDGVIESPYFYGITRDEKNTDLLYCDTGDGIAIYNTQQFNEKLLCKFPKVDEIKYITTISGSTSWMRGSTNDKYIFSVKKDNKYGLWLVEESKRSYKDLDAPLHFEITDIIYDKIEYKHNDFYLYKDGKVGLYTKVSSMDPNAKHFIEVDYDEIKEDGSYFLLFNDGKCNIVSQKDLNIKVSNCEFVDSHGASFVYKMDDKYFLYVRKRDDDAIIGEYDSVKHRSNYKDSDLYIVSKDNKYGIVYSDEEIISPKYDSIYIHGIGESEYVSANYYYLLLEENNKYKLGKFQRKSVYDPHEVFINDGEYDKVDFLKDFMVLYTPDKAILYDYKEEKVIEILPPDTIVEYINFEIKDRNYTDIYIINGEFYLYNNKKLQKALIEDYELYVTSYDTDDTLFEVETVYKDEMERFCNLIDSSTDDGKALELLLKMSENPNKTERDYPKLVLKKIKKDEDKKV